MNVPMMKCGHAANAKTPDGKPICVICAGIKPGADEIDDTPPSLEGRKATCTYCGKEASSSVHLPFFQHRPSKPTDEYYCGCYGWD